MRRLISNWLLFKPGYCGAKPHFSDGEGLTGARVSKLLFALDTIIFLLHLHLAILTMAPPDTIAIASTLAGSCISHISKVSESRRKHKDNYRIALHREFGRFRLWLHGFREPVTGQTIDQRSPNNALDEVLEEATYLKEPTILLLSTFTSCLLSDHLKKGDSYNNIMVYGS